MIEKYIEKEIVRQVKLVEFLYECKKLPLTNLSKRLGASNSTLKRDFDKIVCLLKNDIQSYDVNNVYLAIHFHSTSTRYELVKKIYQQSKFLSVCTRYLLGEEDYLEIVEQEYVSVTTAFRLKRDVEKYLIAAGVLNENQTWTNNERAFRLTVISIWMRYPFEGGVIDEQELEGSEEIVDELLNDLWNGSTVNRREYLLLVLGVYLALKRHHEHPIQEISGNEYLQQSLAFQNLQEKLSLIFEGRQLEESEILFLTSIYKSIEFNAHSYTVVQMNFQYERNYVIEKQKMIQALIFQFEEALQTPLFHQILFERPLILFCYSIWNNLQNYMMYRHHYLNSEQLKLKEKVKNVLIQWKATYWPDEAFVFSELAVEWLTYQISVMLTLKKKNKRVVFIVAESEDSHILFREILSVWLNQEYDMIDPALYYTIDELPEYMKKNPYIIIAERSILRAKEEQREDVFPISIFSLQEDMKKILTANLNVIV